MKESDYTRVTALAKSRIAAGILGDLCGYEEFLTTDEIELLKAASSSAMRLANSLYQAVYAKGMTQ